MVQGLVSYQRPCPSYYHILHVVATVLCPSYDLYRPFFRDDYNDYPLCPSSFLSLLDDEMMAHNEKIQVTDHLLVLVHRVQMDHPSFLYLVHQDGRFRCLYLRLCPCLDFDA